MNNTRKTQAPMVYFCTLLLLLVATIGVMQIGVYLVREASAEGVGDVFVDVEYDHARLLSRKPTRDFAFSNTTALTETFSDVSDNVEKDNGYMYLNASSATDEYANRDIVTTATTGTWEMMWIADTKKAQDVFTMNLTLNRTYDDNDFDNVAIGNEYNVFTVFYKNATGNQTYQVSTQTFHEDVWYVAQVYFNLNYTVDCEFRWKENFTLIDSCHITDANLSRMSNITLMNLSNENGGGGAANAYRVEYAFWDNGYSSGQQSTDGTTGYAPVNPAEEKHVWKFSKNQKIDTDAMDTNYTNKSGGHRNVDALKYGADYWGDGMESTPSAMSDLLMSNNESMYSDRDIQNIIGFTEEKNDTTYHREVYVFGFSDGTDGYEEYMLDNLIKQFGDEDDDTDDAYVVSYRVENIKLHFRFSEALIDTVQDDFAEGMEDSSHIDTETYTDGYTSDTGDDLSDGVEEALDDVHTKSFGTLTLSYAEPDDIANEKGILPTADVWSWGDDIKSGWDGLATFGNGAIGSIVGGGQELVIWLDDFAETTWGGFISDPLSLVFSGTLAKIYWGVIIVFFVIIFLAIYEKQTGGVSGALSKAKNKGKKALKMTG